MTEEYNTIRSGFISLVGRPSSGKSTLINALCGFRVSIVSPQPQSTRYAVRGIVTGTDHQMIFIDTPGYHKFESFLNKELCRVVEHTLNNGDLVGYLVDLSRDFGEEEQAIVDLITPHLDKTVIIFNKEDQLQGTLESNKTFQEIRKRLPNIEYITVSAANESHLTELTTLLTSKLPMGPYYYPEEYVTDQSIPFRIEEVVREKVFEFTKEEIPHSVYVKTDTLKVSPQRIKAYATVYVDRNSQKGIVVGKAGATIKSIGSAARETLLEIFERDVVLFLNVKVHDNWKKDSRFVTKLFEQ